MLHRLQCVTPSHPCTFSARSSASSGAQYQRVHRRPCHRSCHAGAPVGHIMHSDAEQEDGRDHLVDSSGQQQGSAPPPQKQPPEPESDSEGKMEKLLEWMMPRERGDSRDMALLALSIGVFVYLSMHLYNVYAMLYYAAGLKPISHYLH